MLDPSKMEGRKSTTRKRSSQIHVRFKSGGIGVAIANSAHYVTSINEGNSENGCDIDVKQKRKEWII